MLRNQLWFFEPLSLGQPWAMPENEVLYFGLGS